MTSFPASPAAAYLAQVKRRHTVAIVAPRRITMAGSSDDAQQKLIYEDVPVLAAALEAVLALHKPAGTLRTGWGPVCEYDRHRWPCPEHEAIEATLTGTQEGQP